MSLVLITCKNRIEAKMISRHLLKLRLIACANIFPIESLYWWKGKIEEDKEYVIMGKTIKKNYIAIKKEVTKVHSYDVPGINLLPSTANKKYQDWLLGELKR